jgi:hypothetical protein
MHFHVARTASTTGNMLQTMVNQQLQGNTDAMHVCYGVGVVGANVLNRNCSRYSKLEQARILQRGLGPGALPVYETPEEAENVVQTQPLFARNVVHSRGRDIKIALEPWQIRPLMVGGTGFFTPHIPSQREFRVWTYRNRHLGTYEKVLRRPAACKRLGRNYDNGFDFSGVESVDVPQGLKDISRDAIRCLELDFGAVDILQKPDGGYVVLEVNSAPGVSNERRKVIQALSHRIVRWAANGCPERGANGGN